LKLNILKCKILSLRKNVNKDYQYYSKITYLEQKDSFKDLGIIVDEKLSFREYINEKISKAYAMLGVIKRNFKYLNSNSFVLLHKSMVRSHVDYCSSVWAPYKNDGIEMLEKVEKRATQLIMELKNMVYIDHLKLLKLPMLHYRQVRGDMTEMYKILPGKYL